MDKNIKEIIDDDNQTKENKIKKLNSLSEDIKNALNIVSGDYKYCEDCDDYYFSESFIKKKEIEETEICVYQDYINSGNNQYEKGYIDVSYIICPKGHKHEVSRSSPRR